MKSTIYLKKVQKNSAGYLSLIVILLITTTVDLFSQNVLITDDSTYIPKSSAILDVKATDKGFLIPRIYLTSTTSALPILLPDSSLMVYNKATISDVTPGYYYWSGSIWVRIANGDGKLNNVAKTANATLLKTETMILASSNITLTLPIITSADNGLSISVKNVGTYTDLITVMPAATSAIDGDGASTITRWMGKTFVANNGSWIIKEKNNRTENLLDVSLKGSWTTVSEVVAFLNLHMSGPTVVRLCAETYQVNSTQTINLPYPVTFQGLSYGETTIAASAGVSGSPLFTCATECYFKMLRFTAISNTAGNDAIHFTGSGKYHEVKDCSFKGFNKGIVSTNNNDLWIFENDFGNCTGAGVEIAAGAAIGGRLRLSETDFMQCGIGVSLLSAVGETVSIINSAFYNTVSGSDIAILYTPATFTNTLTNTIIITGTAWNNEGTYMSGFDFSLVSGRDANIVLLNNTGMEDEKPHCKIAVNNNAATTTVTTAGTFYKASWASNTIAITCKWTIGSSGPVSGNRLTYQPKNRRDGWAIITGNIAVNNNNRVITIAVYKNGAVTGTRYGDTDLRITAANQPFQFSTVIYLPDLIKNDYLELFVTSAHNGDIIIFQDVQWFTNTQ